MITLMVTLPESVEATMALLGPMAPSPHWRAGPDSKPSDDTGVGLKALRWLISYGQRRGVHEPMRRLGRTGWRQLGKTVCGPAGPHHSPPEQR